MKHGITAVLFAAFAATACGRAALPGQAPAPPSAEELEAERVRLEEEEQRRREAELAAAVAHTRAAVPPRPDLAQPTTTAGTRVWREAVLGRGTRILVSTEGRALWLMRDTLVLFRAPIAVGMEEGFTYNGRRYDFQTPVGRRRVLAKATSPIWTPPDWHYYEIALEKKLQVVNLRRGQRVALSDGSHLEIRGNDVGRINAFGNFWAFTPGTEIIFDGKVFVPPIGTRQRQITEVLGTRKLELGDGYLIHGTNQETSIGDAVSHGCVRMYNEDVEKLYELVPVGTAVFIF